MWIMPRTWSGLKTVGVAIAVALVLLFLLSPMLFFGESPSPFGLVLLAGSLLGAGLLMRMQGGDRQRMVGTTLAVAGAVSLVLAVGLLVVVLASWGP